jgi:hypothetical protein
MNTYKWLSLIALIILISSCSSNHNSLENFDSKAWKADRNACNGERARLTETVLAQKQKLLALDEMEIVEVLGKPDQNELYKRNQKFYFYFLEPGPNCTGGKRESKKLSIRFNAMGLAKEITTEP